MKKSRFREEQIIGMLKQHEAGFRLSERTTCKLLDLERGSYRYAPRPDRNAALRSELLALARQKPRYGYRRLHVLLVRKGHEGNVKRVSRLYVEEGLSVRRKKRRYLVQDRTGTCGIVRLGRGSRGRTRSGRWTSSSHRRLPCSGSRHEPWVWARDAGAGASDRRAWPA